MEFGKTQNKNAVKGQNESGGLNPEKMFAEFVLKYKKEEDEKVQNWSAALESKMEKILEENRRLQQTISTLENKISQEGNANTLLMKNLKSQKIEDFEEDELEKKEKKKKKKEKKDKGSVEEDSEAKEKEKKKKEKEEKEEEERRLEREREERKQKQKQQVDMINAHLDNVVRKDIDKRSDLAERLKREREGVGIYPQKLKTMLLSGDLLDDKEDEPPVFVASLKKYVAQNLEIQSSKVVGIIDDDEEPHVRPISTLHRSGDLVDDTDDVVVPTERLREVGKAYQDDIQRILNRDPAKMEKYERLKLTEPKHIGELEDCEEDEIKLIEEEEKPKPQPYSQFEKSDERRRPREPERHERERAAFTMEEVIDICKTFELNLLIGGESEKTSDYVEREA